MENQRNDNINVKQSNIIIHAAFIIVLLAIVSLKYYLYFGSPETGTGINSARIGATLSHLLIWLFSYSLCIKASKRILIGSIAGFSLFFGILTSPLLGWAGVVVMFIINKKSNNMPINPL